MTSRAVFHSLVLIEVVFAESLLELRDIRAVNHLYKQCKARQLLCEN